MDDATLFRRQLRTLAAMDELIAAAAPENRHLEFDGVSAAIVPATPDRSVTNGVVYERPEALEVVYEELAAAYEESGIRAWTVWVPQADRAVAESLARRGHLLDAAPRAMLGRLDKMRLDSAGLDGIDWSSGHPLSELAVVAGPVFAFGDELALATRNSPPGALCYLAHLEGRPVASVMACHHDGDCGIFWVATLEHAQRRGFATALMIAALRDAQEAGCETTSLQATAQGAPVYSRLGYEDHGAIEMWERRLSPDE
ncbi:MAG: GNAT family N-acetyltransferase [Thermoleophilaceae bacterium]|nr:GNAT family N-acetyltransferase [Thermoleophilaceae bacterium]